MSSRKRTNKTSNTAIIALSVLAMIASGGFVFKDKIVAVLKGGALVSKLSQPEVPTTVPVLIATQDIDEGFELKRTMFRQETREKKELAQVSTVGTFQQLSGLYAKSFIPAGQLLVSDFVTKQAPVNSVVPKIRAGYRAVTVKLDKSTTNEGWARAGVRVDVVLFTNQGFASEAVVIAQNITVLSSGTSVSSEFGGDAMQIQNGESTVTLEVSAADQKRIKLAAGQGELRLLLRGDEDTSVQTDLPFRVQVRSIVLPPEGTREARPSDQGWFMVDGKRYRVLGAALLPV